MATSAIQADGEPRIVGDIIAIDAGDIDASDRLRPVDIDWAATLGHIMAVEGQRTPIEVCRQKKGKPWRLVSGGHRHAAASMFLDLNPLKAIEVEAGELARRQAEVSENLWRRDLNPLDRALHVAEMHDVLRARAGLAVDASPQSIAAHARWKKELKRAAGDASVIVTDAYGFTAQIAEQAGLSKSAIERDLLLARRLSPLIRDRLRGHPVAGNAAQLRLLAKLERDDQHEVAERLLAGEARNVGESIALVRNRPKASAEDRRLSAFIGAFHRMSIGERKGALGQLAGMLPAGWTLSEGERPKAAPEEKYRLQLVECLSGAFKLLLALENGEPVEDEQISSARSSVQLSLMAANAGAIPTPESRQ